MNEPEQLLFFLAVAKRLKDFGEKGFTLRAALNVIDDSYPGEAGKASRDLCGRQLLKVIQEVPEQSEELIFDHGTRFLFIPAIIGLLEQASKSKAL